MTIIVTPEKIKEIACELDRGMKCFYHITSGEIESYPDELRSHTGFEEVLWKDIINKVAVNLQNYISFEAMEEEEAYRIMELFVAGVKDKTIRQRLEDAVILKDPFQNFTNLMNEYPELRQQWFEFKDHRAVEWVREQLDVFNELNVQDKK